MLRLKYLHTSKFYPITSFRNISDHVVEVKGEIPYLSYGFEIYNDAKLVIGRYAKHTTLYRHTEEGLQFSDNHSVWIPTITFKSNGGELQGDLVQHVTDWKYVRLPQPVASDTWKFNGYDHYPPVSGLIREDDTFTAEFIYIPPEPTPIEVLEKKIDAVAADVEQLTPYTDSKKAYIGATSVTFDNVKGKYLTVYAETESGKTLTTSVGRINDTVTVAFDALTEVANISISLL